MKCINCGDKTEGNHIVCPKCSEVDRPFAFLEIHECKSFMQMIGAERGVCGNFLACQPIKKALKNEPLIEPHIGHIICPHASINLRKIIFGEFTEEKLKPNYKECID